MQPYESNVAQVDSEIAALAEVMRRERVGRFLEIGSKFGGSLWRLSRALQPQSRIVSVDMPKGTKAWPESSASLKACIARLRDEGHDAHVIWGGSADEAVIAQVRALGPYDAVFIDGNHTLPFVTRDWVTYGAMARIVAFHDIAWRRAPEWVGIRIDVPEFWQSLKADYRHEEFKFCPTAKNNGIGVLWRS